MGDQLSLLSPQQKRCVSEFNADRTHRIALPRRWQEGGTYVLWVLLNPSQADRNRDENDLTVTKCEGFSKRWGHSALWITNVFSLIATDPRELEGASVDVLRTSQAFMRLVQLAVGAAEILVGWGGSIPKRLEGAPESIVRAIRTVSAAPINCLGTTAGGHPRHPSRLGYDTERVAFRKWA
jgi:hypothetical protein